MSGVFEWPYKRPHKITLDSPVTREKARIDAVYEVRISPAESASQAFDIGWSEGRNAEREDIEERFWSIVDADGLMASPSDMWAALELLCRAARNRDMWKGQCERQAEQLRALKGCK